MRLICMCGCRLNKWKKKQLRNAFWSYNLVVKTIAGHVNLKNIHSMPPNKYGKTVVENSKSLNRLWDELYTNKKISFWYENLSTFQIHMLLLILNTFGTIDRIYCISINCFELSTFHLFVFALLTRERESEKLTSIIFYVDLL